MTEGLVAQRRSAVAGGCLRVRLWPLPVSAQLLRRVVSEVLGAVPADSLPLVVVSAADGVRSLRVAGRGMDAHLDLSLSDLVVGVPDGVAGDEPGHLLATVSSADAAGQRLARLGRDGFRCCLDAPYGCARAVGVRALRPAGAAPCGHAFRRGPADVRRSQGRPRRVVVTCVIRRVSREAARMRATGNGKVTATGQRSLAVAFLGVWPVTAAIALIGTLTGLMWRPWWPALYALPVVMWLAGGIWWWVRGPHATWQRAVRGFAQAHVGAVPVHRHRVALRCGRPPAAVERLDPVDGGNGRNRRVLPTGVLSRRRAGAPRAGDRAGVGAVGGAVAATARTCGNSGHRRMDGTVGTGRADAERVNLTGDAGSASV